MTAAPRATGQTHRAVAVLAALLPAGFRERQAGEWLADLADLPGHPARLRYLLAATWSLPALLAATRRAGGGGGGLATYPVTIVARALLIGLGWPVLSWLVAGPGRWYALDVPALAQQHGGVVDPKDLWPLADVLWPLWLVPTIGAHITMVGWPFLAVSLALGIGIAGPTRRGRTGRQRTVTAVAGLALMVSGLLTVIVQTGMDRVGPGFTVGALGLLCLGLAAHRGLGRATRATLVLVGTAALYYQVTAYTAVGAAMQTWLFD